MSYSLEPSIAAWLAGIREDASHPDTIIVVARANGKSIRLFVDDIRISSDEELLEIIAHKITSITNLKET